jgi:hypothetical protein
MPTHVKIGIESGIRELLYLSRFYTSLTRCKIMTNIMPTHVKISIEPGIRELFLN